MSHWKLDDIPWDQFDPNEVDPDLLAIVKAAGMVEHNGGDYAAYLCNVFHDDPEFQEHARQWAIEEVQHGKALGRWANLADPSFDFDTRFKRFQDGYSVDLNTDSSVRGSRSGELVARCIVETGTSSFYGAIGAASSEPVLKEICRRITADELRHYKLFYDTLKNYLDREKIGRVARARIALSRMAETSDDELAYAYFAANVTDAPYQREENTREYMRRAYAVYRPAHIDRVVAMVFKAAGFNPQSRLARMASWLMFKGMQVRRMQLDRHASPRTLQPA